MPELFPINHFQRKVISTRTPEGSFKDREIFVPDEETRLLHDAVLQSFYADKFLDNSHLPSCAWVDGAMPESQLLDGVLPHKDNWTFYKLDIKNAFPNVDMPTLIDMIETRGKQIGMNQYQRNNLLYFMDEFVTAPGITGLPLGAPCSPFLFNFYCQEIDYRLAAFAEDYGYVYTRYLDDITISSPRKDRTLGEDTRRHIRDIIEDMPGMKVNHAKSQLLNRTNGHVTITGVALYPDGRIQPEPKLINKVLAAFESIENDVISGRPMTMHDVGVVDGYHGVLKSMAVEPYNKTMQEAFETYHHVAYIVRAAIDTNDYAEPARKPPTPEKIAEAEAYLVDAVHGGAAERTELAVLYPGVWKAFIQKGMFDESTIRPLAHLRPLDPIVETKFEGTEGADGPYLF